MSNKTHREIAFELGIHESFSKRVVRKSGVVGKRIRPDANPQNIAKVKNLWEEGKKGLEISSELGLPIHYVRKILSNVESYSVFTYSYNKDFFEKIDTEEKAYWLGFLYADGNVSSDSSSRKNNRISLKLSKKDKEHLKKFKRDINSNHPIKEQTTILNNKEFETVHIRICGDKLKQDLIRLGCTPNKTFTTKFPTHEQVPIEHKPHFVRGYFDGDGWITSNNYREGVEQYQIGFVGSDDFVLEMADYLGITTLYRDKNHSEGILKAYSGGNLKTMKILDSMYEGSTVYLERKKEKYEKLKSLYN